MSVITLTDYVPDHMDVAGEDFAQTLDVKFNAVADVVNDSPAVLFAYNEAGSTGLNLAYHAGRVRNGATVTEVAASTIALTDNATNYVEVNSSGTVSKNTTGFSSDKKPICTAVTLSGAITSVTPKRVAYDFASGSLVTGSTDNALLRADGTGGSTSQGSAITVDDNGGLVLPELSGGSVPGTPSAGKRAFYAKSGGFYEKDSSGTETLIGGSGSGDMLKSTYDPNNDGVIAIAQGGTGATTASAARTALGLGSVATQASSSVSITGGSITGITDLAIADGGTGASTAAAAFANLKQAATTSTTGVVELATDGETASGVVVQGNDSRLSDARTPSIHGQTAVTSLEDADEFVVYDNSATAIRKVTAANVKAYLSASSPAIHTITSVSNAVSFDVADSDLFALSLSENTTLTPTSDGDYDGQTAEIRITPTGTRTITFGTGIVAEDNVSGALGGTGYYKLYLEWDLAASSWIALWLAHHN